MMMREEMLSQVPLQYHNVKHFEHDVGRGLPKLNCFEWPAEG